MRLHHKLILMLSLTFLVVLVGGAAGLFVVDKLGEDTRAVLEGKVAVADASSEIINTITNTDALVHQHMLTDDLDRLDRIEREVMEYHDLDNMWVGAVTYGTKSREFTESEEYSLWLKYGYGTEGIVIRKADPEVISIIEEVSVNHGKLHATAWRLMKLHRKKVVIQQNITDLYSKEELQRHRVRDIIRAQGDYLLMDDIWGVEYTGREAMFQHRDKKHTDEWIEAVETLQRDVASSTLAPGAKSEIQDYSSEYLSLARTISKEVLKLNELDAKTQTQRGVFMEYAVDIDANVADIKTLSFAARSDAKSEIQTYITNMFTLVAVTMAVVIVFILFAGYLTNKFISRPIIKLRDATRKAGAGDFDVRIKVYRGDELGELADAFNKMTADLKTYRDGLLSAKEYTDNIVRSMGESLVVVSPEGNILSTNPATCAMLGYEEKELIGQPIGKIFAEESPFKEPVPGDLTDQGVVRNREKTYLSKDGRKIPVLFSSSLMQNNNGTIQGMVHVAQDITERKRMEAELEQTLTELERSNTELQQFAYVASHDLQEPLRMVTSYVQLLARRYKGQLDADADDFIGYAVDGAVRMQKLIDGLLTYSRVGTCGKDFEPVDCETVIDQVLTALQIAIEESGAVITHDPLPTVMADDLQLGQLFQNLIGNAIKFHDGGPPQVHISAERKGDECVLSVRDSGIGIDPEYADRIFMVFQRLHSKEEYPGTGIGLAVCKRIVERHSGRIWVESKPGNGATFYFIIPTCWMKMTKARSVGEAKRDVLFQDQNEREVTTMNTEEIGRPIEILLVEDNPGDVRLTQEVLRESKLRNNLRVVGDGVEALAFLRRDGEHADAPRPDIILLDLNMPKKDGREVLSEIKADDSLKRIPVVVLTTSKAEQDILKSYDLHANCYITKPVDIEQFITVVKSIQEFWFTIVKLPQSE